jgi:hypothetical protein
LSVTGSLAWCGEKGSLLELHWPPVVSGPIRLGVSTSLCDINMKTIPLHKLVLSNVDPFLFNNVQHFVERFDFLNGYAAVLVLIR